MVSRISGIGILGIEKKIKELHKKAFQKNVSILPIGGIYKYRKNGEVHQYQGKLIHLLQSAVTKNSYSTYKKYVKESQLEKMILVKFMLNTFMKKQ